MTAKPSSKFRVVLHQNNDNTSALPAPVIAKSSVSNTSLCKTKQLSSFDVLAVVCHSSVPGNDASQIAADVPPRRYGGAIVRVSDLKRAGGAPLLSAEGLSGETSHVPLVSWHDVGLSRSRTRASSATSNRAAPPKRARASYASRGRSKSSGKTKKTGKRAANGKSKRSRSADIELPLQPNGRPFDFSWATVRGRRQLRYNGKIFRGSAAHAMWAKIKKAGEASAPHVPPPRAPYFCAPSRPPAEGTAPRRPSSRAAEAVALAAPLLDDESVEDEVIVLSSSNERDDNDKDDGVSEHSSLSWGSGSLETPSTSGSSDAGNAVESSEGPYPAYPQPLLRGSNKAAEGMVFLGSAAAAQPRQAKAAAAVVSGSLRVGHVYAQRYEELDGLDGIPSEDVEGMFVVGDEIGGMRFAP